MQLQGEIYLFLLGKLSQVRDYKSGIKACCPFHDENTPSFFVFYSEKHSGWFYKCHGCPPERSSGSLHKLLRYLKGPVELAVKPDFVFSKPLDIPEIIHTLVDPTKGFPEIYDYFLHRGITFDVAKTNGFRMSLSEQPSVIMPVYFESRYCGYVKRYLDPEIKYRYELQEGADFSDALWGYDGLDVTKPTFIVEGIIDAACLKSLGYQAVALVTGKKWQSKVDYLQMLEQPLCLPDNGDKNSIDSFLELAIKIGGRLVFLPPEIKDVSAGVMVNRDKVLDWLTQVVPQVPESKHPVQH